MIELEEIGDCGQILLNIIIILTEHKHVLFQLRVHKRLLVNLNSITAQIKHVCLHVCCALQGNRLLRWLVWWPGKVVYIADLHL